MSVPTRKPSRSVTSALTAAFDRGDAAALAEFWTPDGDYMDELGHLYKGREAIKESFEKLFSTEKGAKLKIHRTAFRFVRPDLAIGDGIMEVLPAGDVPPTAARFTTVQVKKDGQWLIESVREATVSARTMPRNWKS